MKIYSQLLRNGAKPKRHRHHSCGAALVELALCLPLLSFIIFGGTELSRLIKIEQGLRTLSQEIANPAYRDCSVMNNVNTCLVEIMAEAQLPASAVLPNAQMIASVWRWDATALPQPRCSMVAQVTGVNGGTSRINTNNFLIGSSLSDLCQNHGVLAFGEVQVPYQPTTAWIGGVLDLDKTRYAITVY